MTGVKNDWRQKWLTLKMTGVKNDWRENDSCIINRGTNWKSDRTTGQLDTRANKLKQSRKTWLALRTTSPCTGSVSLDGSPTQIMLWSFLFSDMLNYLQNILPFSQEKSTLGGRESNRWVIRVIIGLLWGYRAVVTVVYEYHCHSVHYATTVT